MLLLSLELGLELGTRTWRPDLQDMEAEPWCLYVPNLETVRGLVRNGQENVLGANSQQSRVKTLGATRLPRHSRY